MSTLILTILLIVVGYVLSFEIARRKRSFIAVTFAYLAGLFGALLATAVVALFETGPTEGAELAPIVALLAPAVGVFNGRRKLKSEQDAKSARLTFR